MTITSTHALPSPIAARTVGMRARTVLYINILRGRNPIVHNHPSGDPTPSRADIEMTKQVVAAALAIGIVVHDHVIVGHGRSASFKALGLL